MNIFKKVLYGKKLQVIIDEGKKNFKSENYFSAIKDFSYALEIDKTNKEALYNRGIVYFKTKHFNDSKSDLLALDNIDTSFNPLTCYYLSKIYLRENDTKNAVIYADKYYLSNPNDVNIQFFTARAKYYNGNYEDALILADRLCEVNPENFNVRYLKSLIFFTQKNYHDSLLEIDKAIEISSIEAFLFNLRGLVNVEIERYSEAIEDFDYAIRLNPSNSLYYFNKAKILFQEGNIEESKNNIAKVLELDSNNKSAILLSAEINILTENYQDAVDDFSNYLLKDPNNVDVLVRSASIKNVIYDFEGAREDLKKAISFNKGNADLYYQLAFVEFKTNKLDDAAKNLEVATEKNPEFSNAFLQKGIIEFLNNKFVKCIESLDKYLFLQPNTEKAIIIKTKALIELDRNEEAKDELLKIKDVAIEDEYFLLSSKLNLDSNNIELAQLDIQKVSDSGRMNNSVELINNVLKMETGLEPNLRPLDENEFDKVNKQNSQILNALINFEKKQYNTVKYRLSMLTNLEKKTEEQLRPLYDFINKEIG